MFIVSFLITVLIGTLEAHQPDIDINRLKLIPDSVHRSENFFPNYHNQRSLRNQYIRSNDYDDHSRWSTEPRAPWYFLHDAPTLKQAKTIKVQQPREDPRLYYQSDAYLKETNQKNINNEVSSIYPGIEVIRADDVTYRSKPIRLKNEPLKYFEEDSHICIKCPHDRTLIAKPGFDRVILKQPDLLTCSGRRPPRNANFVHLYGPKFGSLLKQGYHTIIGQITYNSKVLQTCKLQINVLRQSCPIPNYLVSHCDDYHKSCNFTCRDSKSELHGMSSLKCGDDFRWTGNLPICKARSWCKVLSPPEQGRYSCKGVAVNNGSGLTEGSICRIRCPRGWRWSSRTAAVCRRGVWTHDLTCQPKKHVKL